MFQKCLVCNEELTDYELRNDYFVCGKCKYKGAKYFTKRQGE